MSEDLQTRVALIENEMKHLGEKNEQILAALTEIQAAMRQQEKFRLKFTTVGAICLIALSIFGEVAWGGVLKLLGKV